MPSFWVLPIVIDRRSNCPDVLITVGHSANGKYSQYLLLQVPEKIGADIHLVDGAYVIGWTRGNDGLPVHIYAAETGGARNDRGASADRGAVGRLH